jgi:outer membrane protein OmpA-like peptidoglycan-associated protein
LIEKNTADMNLKLLIFGVFTAWVVLCTRWYVCEIQQSCYEPDRFESLPETVSRPVAETLSVANEPVPQAPKADVQKKPEKRPEVNKPEPAAVKSVKKTAVPEAKSADTAVKQTGKETVAKPSNLTAKGGSPFVPATKTAAKKSTRQILVEKEKNKLTVSYPQQYTEKAELAAVSSYIDELVRQWKKTGGKITVTGHTDFIGSADANYEVGMERAQNIRNILKSKGVPASRITCISEGEDMPRASNDTPYGRFQNRRVEIVIKK